MTLNKVKTVNIESFFIGEFDILDINHYGSYYSKTYKDKEVSFFKVPFIKEIVGLNLSISLNPVTGESGLYVNPNIKPLELDKYAWKETGHLATRITITWEELMMMQATQ